MELLRGVAAINQAIDNLAIHGKRLDDMIQLIVVSAMDHHRQHGDTSLLTRFVLNMPKGSRVDALRKYIVAFAGVEYDAKQQAFKHVKGKASDIETAMTTHWTTFKPKPKPKAVKDEDESLADRLSEAFSAFDNSAFDAAFGMDEPEEPEDAPDPVLDAIRAMQDAVTALMKAGLGGLAASVDDVLETAQAIAATRAMKDVTPVAEPLRLAA